MRHSGTPRGTGHESTEVTRCLVLCWRDKPSKSWRFRDTTQWRYTYGFEYQGRHLAERSVANGDLGV
jgi:hypothetical protein